MPILGKSKHKVAPPTFRVDKVVIPPKPKPRSSLAPTNGHASQLPSLSPGLSPNPRIPRKQSVSPYPSSSDEKRNGRKRKIVTSTPRDSPAFGNDSDSDDNVNADPFVAEKKRARLAESRSEDVNRRVRHKKGFGDNVRESGIIHAADFASIAANCVPIFGAKEDEVAVELQYPSRCRPERYDLVWKKDKIDVVKDILDVIKYVGEVYLTDEEAEPFINHQVSFRRQMERASNEKIGDLATFKSALKDYNRALQTLIENGSVARNLDSKHHLPLDLVSFILDQVYDRTVAPKAEILNKYKTGSDNVYGELKHLFIHKILVGHGNMKSDQVFVDLGSGVGNVVLQAALEIGCRSYGCEMVETSCNFAEAQEKEFKSRCLLWGVAPGRVHLERGDFRTNRKTLEMLKEADVVLVNNKAFTEGLNKALVDIFLDLKKGCKIISLKSFVHDNKGALNDIANSILHVEEHTYPSGSVSWAASEGDYYVSTKK